MGNYFNGTVKISPVFSGDVYAELKERAMALQAIRLEMDEDCLYLEGMTRIFYDFEVMLEEAYSNNKITNFAHDELALTAFYDYDKMVCDPDELAEVMYND